MGESDLNERQMVLKMLEEGKITAAEAADLLKALGGGAGEGGRGDKERGDEGRDARRERRRHHDRVRGDWPGPTPHPGHALRGFFRDFADSVRVEMEGFPLWWPGNSFEFQDEVQGEFGAGLGEARVTVNAANGPVTLRDWDGPGWKVHLVKRVRGADRAAAEERAKALGHVASSDGSLEVEGDRGWTGMASLAVELLLPRQVVYQARLRTANGGIEITGLKFGSVEAETANGRIRLDRVTGDTVTLETSNGGIGAHCGARRLEATTRNGGLNLEVLPGHPGDYRLTSLNGGITARLPAGPGVAYDVEGKTMVGHVDVNLPDVESEREDRRLVGRHVRARSRSGAGRDKITVSARTSSGSVEFIA